MVGSRSGRSLLVVVALAVAALSFGAYALRREVIGRFFPDGEPGPVPVWSASGLDGRAVSPAPRLRVVLIDGLGEEAARGLPALDALCARGLELRVDNGFPTVSLPVQHVLWTGRTQQQSGVQYRVEGLREPPPDALPVRVDDSIAVAESHRDIVHSFGFATTLPELEDEAIEAPGSAWRTELFASAAQDAVASPARLVFVHVLAVDEAGHRSGADSEDYMKAVARADGLLGSWIEADPEPTRTRWIVLSDHGHRDAGGHGGAEPWIRKVRACITGGPPLGIEPPSGRPAEVHLVDLHRVLAESLGLDPAPDARGRSLDVAIATSEPDATLPRVSTTGWVAAAILALLGMVATGRAARGRPRAFPWWYLAAYLCVVTLHGSITLSNPVVYPPLGLDMVVGTSLGSLVMLAAWRELGRGEPLRFAVAQLALPWCLSAAALAACGAWGVLLGLRSGPPLIPVWTAHASLGLTACMVGSLWVAALIGWRAWCSRYVGSIG